MTLNIDPEHSESAFTDTRGRLGRIVAGTPLGSELPAIDRKGTDGGKR